MSEIHARRLNAKEILRPKMVNTSYSQSPVECLNCMGDQGIRKSTLIRNDPERGELRDDLRGESDGSQRIDTMIDDREVRNDFWSIEGNYMYRHQVGPGVQLFVPKEESFPMPLRYTNVIRENTCDLGCDARKPDR